MSTLPLSDDEATVRFLGPGEFIICGDPLHVTEAITFFKGQARTVPRPVVEWALGMNTSRQAEVFELVTEGGGE